MKFFTKEGVVTVGVGLGLVSLVALIGIEVGDYYETGPSDWVFGDDDREAIVTVGEPEPLEFQELVTENADGTVTITHVDAKGNILAVFTAEDVSGTNARLVIPN